MQCDPQSLTDMDVQCWHCGVQDKNCVGWSTIEVRINQLIHCAALLYIVRDSGHQVKPECAYWLLAVMLK